jgi:hypothetical protein
LELVELVQVVPDHPATVSRQERVPKYCSQHEGANRSHVLHSRKDHGRYQCQRYQEKQLVRQYSAPKQSTTVDEYHFIQSSRIVAFLSKEEKQGRLG